MPTYSGRYSQEEQTIGKVMERNDYLGQLLCNLCAVVERESPQLFGQVAGLSEFWEARKAKARQSKEKSDVNSGVSRETSSA